MAFFGLENNALEEERRRFAAGELKPDEDIAVYNWGAEDYDGLGNALQEGGDDFNDETFGGTGPVGKDFDFTSQRLPDMDRPSGQRIPSGTKHAQLTFPHTESDKLTYSVHQTTKGRDSAWDDKSPFSVLRSSSGIGRRSGSALGHQASPSLSNSRSVPSSTLRQQTQSPSLHQPAQANSNGMVDYSAPGTRSLAEIEAEMRAASQKAREQQQRQLLQEQQQQQQQQQLLHEQKLQQEQLMQQYLQQQQQQQLIKPPRMRSESPSVYQNVHINAPQASYHIQNPLGDTYRQQQQQQQQQALLQEVENMRIQDALHQRKEPAYMPMDLRQHNQTPIEFMLQKNAERERVLQQGVIHPGPNDRLALHQRQLQQQRINELHEYREQGNHSRNISADEFQANLRRQMAADQQRQAQLAAAGLLEPRRESPMDHLHHQLRLAMANEMASKARGEHQPNLFGANPADIAQMQMQQRMLAQLAQQEFSQSMNVINGSNGQDLPNSKNQEALRAEAVRKIMEAERQEGKRRRKAQKIAHMSRYNDLMTQSDKDFITRIQVSQLVTSDPYTEDYYAQEYAAKRSRHNLNLNEERVLKFGSGEGVGLGFNPRAGGRRPNAMQRMEAQVERIVNNARQREKEKGLHAIHSLQGALGKTAGRSYKAAPRQLLQVDTNGTTDPTSANAHGHISKDDSKRNAAGATKEAAKRGREALGVHGDPSGAEKRDPLTRRECLVILESLYDSLQRIEQMQREHPPNEHEGQVQEWTAQYKAEIAHLWDSLRVMVPLESCDPHPFISLLGPSKGKMLLSRLIPHLETQQKLQIICLIVACFSQLDVVKNASELDSQVETPKRIEVDNQTELFSSRVLSSMFPSIASFHLGIVVGMMGVLMEHCNMELVVHSKPGQSLLTAFLSRVEVIKSDMMSGNSEPSEIPSEEELASWNHIVAHLFHIIAPFILTLFPSSRVPSLRTSVGVTTFKADLRDQPVWQFLATFALHADHEMQQFLVTRLREKILDNVLAVSKGFVTNEEEQNLKITNVNILLHALGLDSSQITL